MDITYCKKLEPFWGVWYIDRELGAGSYGRVFSIKREDFGETYYSALKVISIPNDNSEITSLRSEGMDENSISQYYESFANELVKEFSLMAKIKGHSNIVSYEDHMTIKHEDGLGYDILIRMELLTPLNDYLLKNTITEKMIINLGIDICKALEACEKQNIIHRDIKPENVFVSALGSYKLGDFGVSRVASQATQGMSIKGTISYMAPEVYKGQTYNRSVDIYSLGIMMYKLVNNNRGPFLPPAPQTIKYADRETAENLRMGGTELPDVTNASPELMSIIKKAASYNPEDRYKSAFEMREALEMFLINLKAGNVVDFEERTIAITGDHPAAPGVVPNMPEQTVGRTSSTVTMVENGTATILNTVSAEKDKTNRKKPKWVIGLVAAVAVILVLIVAIGLGSSSGSSEDRTSVKKNNTSKVSTNYDDDDEEDYDDEDDEAIDIDEEDFENYIEETNAAEEKWITCADYIWCNPDLFSNYSLEEVLEILGKGGRFFNYNGDNVLIDVNGLSDMWLYQEYINFYCCYYSVDGGNNSLLMKFSDYNTPGKYTLSEINWKCYNSFDNLVTSFERIYGEAYRVVDDYTEFRDGNMSYTIWKTEDGSATIIIYKTSGSGMFY